MNSGLLNINKIINGDSLEILKTLPDESIDCCVTSPPYYGLRDYGHKNQIGLEETPQLFVEKMVSLFSQVRRILKPSGTLWLNIGDSYASGPRNRTETQAVSKSKLNGGLKSQCQILRQINKISEGLKPKDLIGIPWLVAFALRADGWYLRQDIIWHKPNPMPESVADRCTKSHEYIFLFSKSRKYFFDQDSIKTPLRDASLVRLNQDLDNQKGSERIPGKTNNAMKAVIKGHSIGGNGKYTSSDDKRHRTKSGKNWAPKLYEHRGDGDKKLTGHSGNMGKDGNLIGNGFANKKSVWSVTTKAFSEAHFATFPEELIVDCLKAGCPDKGIILDPFMGAGTTALVARKLNRNFIGIELNPDYIKIAEERLRKELGMFL